MNVVWIVADTFRKDHLGAYGNDWIRTPSLDALAARGVRLDRHYAAGFPTMPTRADHATGRWTMSFMGWEPLPDDVITLAQLLGSKSIHTAAVVDTPFYWRHGMNYDRGFFTFFTIQAQEGSATRVQAMGWHESRDERAWWRLESDRNTPRTIKKALDWLELHYKDDFFLYIDTCLVTTVTAEEWSLLYSVEPGMSELYHLPSDPRQEKDLVHQKPEVAKELHQHLIKFMRETRVADHLIKPRSELRL